VESQISKKTTLKNTHNDGFYESSLKDANKNFTKTSPSNFSKETTTHQKVSKDTFLPLPLSHPPKPPI